MKHTRPKHILFTAYDPFDDQMICSSLLEFDRRKSANGFYRKYAERVSMAARIGAPHIIENRDPFVTTEIIWE